MGTEMLIMFSVLNVAFIETLMNTLNIACEHKVGLLMGQAHYGDRNVNYVRCTKCRFY